MSEQRFGKLLIAIVGRHRGEKLVAEAKAAGARGGTIALGKTLADNSILQALSLADILEDVVFILMGGEKEAVMNAIKEAAKKSPKKLGGMGFVLDIDSMLIRESASHGEASGPAATGSGNKMESGYKLITVIVNHGYAQDVMAVAKKAGAGGGTIMTARGTGTADDVKFFGISLVPEKEMLMIVATREDLPGVIEAVSAMPCLREPGGGVVYTCNVEEFISLGG